MAALGPRLPITSVWPSGSARSMACIPITPPAPGRFSTTTGCPSCSESVLPSRRLVRSRMPPGELGAIRRKGRLAWKLSWDGLANARPAVDTTARQASAWQRKRRFMVVSCLIFSDIYVRLAVIAARFFELYVRPCYNVNLKSDLAQT
ncbi:hypothetical protein CBM2637_B50034 [Cupriavidus taiwanensis]|nr:hypothetical protein CBM2637_B50034 [Cupriavidus taiwanensis]